jgi:hypothetical protein
MSHTRFRHVPAGGIDLQSQVLRRWMSQKAGDWREDVVKQMIEESWLRGTAAPERALAPFSSNVCPVLGARLIHLSPGMAGVEAGFRLGYPRGVDSMAKFPVEQWQAHQLRLTVFPPPNANDRRSEWWQRMTGTEPSESTTDRKRNTSLVSGEFGGGDLTLGLTPERIDWILTAAAAEPIDPAISIEDIGPMIQSVDQFSALAERWLAEQDIPEVARLAFGAILTHPEADLTAGYLRLRDYVPIPVDPDWRDFVFQVNIRNLQMAAYGITYLNRLSRWSVAARVSSRLSVTPQGIAISGIGTSQHGLRLELDINTPADLEGLIPRQQLAELYREMAAAGRAIANDGVVHEQYRLQ